MELSIQHSAARMSQGKHSVTMLFATWLLVGVFIDGFAHRHGAVESFFTPWHAILYSGFLACAIWIFFLTLQNKRSATGIRWVEAVPTGYGLGMAGVIIFLLGGVGDMIWHIVFGIEENIEALLSPTHLVLLSGCLLIMTSPYRAALAEHQEQNPSFRALLPSLTSLALTFSSMAFFLMYAWSFQHPFWRAANEDDIARTIVNFLMTTMLLAAPLMMTLKHWKLPFGAATFFFGFEAVLLAVLDGFISFDSILILLGSGFIGDLLFHEIKEKPAGHWRYRLVFFLLPVLIWSLYFLEQGVLGRLTWSPELWGGAIFLSGLLSFGLSILAAPVQARKP